MRKRDQVQRRIFQIAYYESLLATRAALLEQSGYAVSSALGNEGATAAKRLLANTDAVLIGFSGPYPQRAAMLRWVKEQRPEVPVLVLQSRLSEAFAEADGVALADNPETWLAALAECIERRLGA